MTFSLGSGGKAVQKEAHTQTVICTARITLRRPVLSERSLCPKYGSNQQIILDVNVTVLISGAITEGNDVGSALTLTPMVFFPPLFKMFLKRSPKSYLTKKGLATWLANQTPKRDPRDRSKCSERESAKPPWNRVWVLMPGPVCPVLLPNHVYWSGGQLERYLLHFHPSTTKPSKQCGQATSRNPQHGPERRDPQTMKKVAFSKHGLIESYVHSEGSLWRQSVWHWGVSAHCVE